jgi:riboflavin biosynthesis pyrimidine reductase
MTAGRIFVDITMSVDGFIAGPKDGVDNPLGDGGERLHDGVYEAPAAAGGKGVAFGGGANTIQQAFNAGLIDEVQLHIAPIVLGGGIRLFDQGTRQIEPTSTRVIQSLRVTHLKYDVVK